MDLKQFSDRTADGVRRFLGPDANVRVREVRKNNGIVLHGMTVTDKRSNLSPTIYMEPFYDAYQAGKPFGEIVQDIVKIYEETKIRGKVDMDFFADYEKTRKRIFCKLINYERNRELLGEVPHIRYLDLAIVCYYSYVSDMVGSGTITIRNSLLDTWQIGEQQLLQEAMDNTEKTLRCRWYDMKAMMRSIVKECGGIETAKHPELSGEACGDSMYVVTNCDKYFGAACMISEKSMRRMGEIIGGDFLILPSSIHESATR